MSDWDLLRGLLLTPLIAWTVFSIWAAVERRAIKRDEEALRQAIAGAVRCDCPDYPAEVERDCCCVGGNACRPEITR